MSHSRPNWDGRWVALLMLAGYYVLLFSHGLGENAAQRWRTAGVFAYPAPFMDLQLFPAARANLSEGRDLYEGAPGDPLSRAFNYPRAWLLFMRFSGSDRDIRTVGVAMAGITFAAILLFCGRQSVSAGFVTGLLLCSPAIQLGVERGNTDQLIFCLIAAGIWLSALGPRSRQVAGGLWWAASALKLFPIVAFAGWFEGPVQKWVRRVWIPLALFGCYLALSWPDISLVIRNTGRGWVSWVQSYGTTTLATAAHHLLSSTGGDPAVAIPLAHVGRILGIAGAGLMAWRGRGQPPLPTSTESVFRAARFLLGFRIGALLYVGTFISGSNYDYRLIFLLLTVPQLLSWHRLCLRSATFALAALGFTLGINFVLGSWPGFFINEAASWILLLILATQLGRSWALEPVALRAATVPDPSS